MAFLGSFLMTLYLLVFNIIYPLTWYTSYRLTQLTHWMVGKKISPKFTDMWATGWGIGQMIGSFFINRTKVEMHIDPKIRDYDGPFLVLMNHQATFDIGLAYHIMWQLKRTLRWVLKKELMYAPGVGAGCRAMRCAFIDRKDRVKAEKELRAFAEDIYRDQVSAVIFVEGTRATDQKLKNSDFQTLLNPKPFGASILYNSLEEWPVLSVTIDWLGKRGQTMFGTQIWKSTVKVDLQLHSHEEIGEDIGSWMLQKDWPRREAMMKGWRKAEADAQPAAAIPLKE